MKTQMMRIFTAKQAICMPFIIAFTIKLSCSTEMQRNYAPTVTDDQTAVKSQQGTPAPQPPSVAPITDDNTRLNKCPPSFSMCHWSSLDNSCGRCSEGATTLMWLACEESECPPRQPASVPPNPVPPNSMPPNSVPPKNTCLCNQGFKTKDDTNGDGCLDLDEATKSIFGESCGQVQAIALGACEFKKPNGKIDYVTLFCGENHGSCSCNASIMDKPFTF